MKIKDIQVFSKNLKLTKPYTISYKTISDVENVFLIITLENGVTGIGAANPDLEVVGESPTETLQNCQSTFFQNFIGKDIRQFRSLIWQVHNTFPNKPGTQAIWDIALHDAFGKYLNIPVVDIYGRQKQEMTTSVTIGIKDVEDTLREAIEYYKMGFRTLKIKTGQNPDIDIERVLKIHEKYKDVSIRVDANQGYTKDVLLQFYKATEHIELEVIEQPLAVGQEHQLLDLPQNLCKKLVADESLKNAKSAIQFGSQPQLFGVYNIKLMKCGGLLGAFEIATIAKAAGINLFWGCNDESIISITAALHAAFACPLTQYLDLDGSLDLAEDIVNGGFILKDGQLSISQISGFGYNLI